jgi:type IV pilus assembly protein PilX
MAQCTQTIRRPRRFLRRRPQQGFVLMVGLILLVVVTLLSMSMFRSFGMQERMAGNTRDKQRSYEAAQSALQFGEWWLQKGETNIAIACSGVINGNVFDDIRICDSPLTTPENLSSWTSRIDYVPPGMTVAAGGGVAASGDINYQSKPSLHIHYLGVADGGKNLLFQVSAMASGGNPDTVSVIQSTFKIGVAANLESEGTEQSRKEPKNLVIVAVP